MHPSAHDYVAEQVAKYGPFVSVLEVGSRNVNGGVRYLFGECVYEGVDIVDGDGVDFVCDATVWLPSGPYDCVVCCEVFEHVAAWPAIVDNAFKVLMPNGVLLLTMAGPGRTPHSAIDGGPVRPGEFYGNVQPDELLELLLEAGFTEVEIDTHVSGDLYATARKESVA
jgi:hypothetical protein